MAPGELTHRHAFFGHACERRPGAADPLRRFAAGGGALHDLGYLVDDTGRRLAAPVLDPLGSKLGAGTGSGEGGLSR